MINWSKVKDFLIVVSIIVGALFYLIPGNYLDSRFDFLHSIFRSLIYELILAGLLIAFLVYRKNIATGFKKAFEKNYFENLPFSFKAIAMLILFSGIFISYKTIRNTIINRSFYYQNILPNKYVDDLTFKANNFEAEGNFDNAIRTYRKILNQSLSVSNKERINSKINILTKGIELSEELTSRCPEINKNSTLQKSQFNLIKNAKRLNPMNQGIEIKYNDYVSHINNSIDSLQKLIVAGNNECDYIMDKYGWLIIDKPLLATLQARDSLGCTIFRNAIQNYMGSDIKKALQIDWKIKPDEVLE